MPVTSMSLTPRLKRVWRRINKGSPDSRADDPRAHHPSITFGGGRKYDLSVPGVRCLEPIADDVPTSLQDIVCRSHSERASEKRRQFIPHAARLTCRAAPALFAMPW